MIFISDMTYLRVEGVLEADQGSGTSLWPRRSHVPNHSPVGRALGTVDEEIHLERASVLLTPLISTTHDTAAENTL